MKILRGAWGRLLLGDAIAPGVFQLLG